MPKLNNIVKAKKKPAPPKKTNPIFQCSACGKYKSGDNFYKSYGGEANGIIPYCKNCIQKMCSDTYGNLDKQRAIETLRMIDKPFLHELWETEEEKAKEKGKETNWMGKYLGRLAISKYRHLSWQDGDLGYLTEEEANVRPSLTDIKYSQPYVTIIEEFKKFKVTDEMVRLFGSGYTDEEYYYMWTKYEFLRQNYTETTSMHTEALVTYVRYKVKEEMAVKDNKPADAKTWGEMAQRQAERAKINPNQLSKADLQGGLSTIGDIALMVEQYQDIVPQLPRFMFRPNDAVDFCIWNYINYARDLEGKPPVEYHDVYQFYDKKKKEFVQSGNDYYNIFKDDPTVENREKVEAFIKLPDEYYEENGDDE